MSWSLWAYADGGASEPPGAADRWPITLRQRGQRTQIHSVTDLDASLSSNKSSAPSTSSPSLLSSLALQKKMLHLSLLSSDSIREEVSKSTWKANKASQEHLRNLLEDSEKLLESLLKASEKHMGSFWEAFHRLLRRLLEASEILLRNLWGVSLKALRSL